MKNISVRTITGIAIILALEIIFQAIGNMVSIGPISLNLSLIPIVIAAIIYGPWGGAFIGFANGFMVLFASTTQIFIQTTFIGTILVCVLKTSIAGFVSGLLFKFIGKKHEIFGSILASLVVPIINSSLFAVASFTVFMPVVEKLNVSNVASVNFIFLTLIGFNFIFEFGITILLSPSILKIVQIYRRGE